MRAQNLTALVLHVRAYRETSAIVQFFTEEAGRVAGVVRGVRGSKRGARIEPFCTGEISCSGRGGLLSITHFDLRDSYALKGDCLTGGFYVLEVLSRVLDERQSEPLVYSLATQTLANLSALMAGAPGLASTQGVTVAMAAYLRVFEAELLGHLGYKPNLATEARHKRPIEAHSSYWFDSENGLLEVTDAEPKAVANAIPGHVISAIANGDFAHPGALSMARTIYQQALEPLLGSKPLVSRTLWQSRFNSEGNQDAH